METFTGQVPELGPISNAVVKNGHFYCAAVPVHPTGEFATGALDVQARLAFANLRSMVEDAGGVMGDITQVTVYLTDIDGSAVVNRVWREFFHPPYPNRATIGVRALAVDGMAVELVASGVIG